jgi:hypothetical protein
MCVCPPNEWPIRCNQHLTTFRSLSLLGAASAQEVRCIRVCRLPVSVRPQSCLISDKLDVGVRLIAGLLYEGEQGSDDGQLVAQLAIGT